MLRYVYYGYSIEDRLITRGEIVVNLQMKTISKRDRKVKQIFAKQRPKKAQPVTQTLDSIQEEDEEMDNEGLENEFDDVPQEDGTHDDSLDDANDDIVVVSSSRPSKGPCAERDAVAKDLQTLSIESAGKFYSIIYFYNKWTSAIF